MRKIVILVSLLALASTTAWAGFRVTATVSIDTVNRMATGSVGSARASVDTVQYIGCNTYAWTDGTYAAECRARTATGTSLGCYTTSPNLVAVAGRVNPMSWVNFRVDASGGCLMISVNNDSMYAPAR